jgi:xanthine dehydrogenase YagS FAD-binding subunit
MLPGAAAVEELPDGGLRIGAATTLETLARHALVGARFPLVALAAGRCGTSTAEPAERARWTLAGNLRQRPRCQYLRANDPACLKAGGDRCPAVTGANRHHAILAGGPCWIVHPSDLATALVALEATIEVAGAGSGVRHVPAGEFFVGPTVRLDREDVLAPHELVTAVELPGASAFGTQRWFKATEPAIGDVAVVSLAAVKRTDGEVRLVLGGVAPVPYRLYGSIEEDVSVGRLDPHDVETLADRAMYDAVPLSQNGYKVDVATALLREAVEALGRA